MKQPWKNKLLLSMAVLLGCVVVIALLKLIFLDFVVDLWWFQSLELTQYFLLRTVYRYLVFAFFGAVFFAIFYFNFWVATRFVGFGDKPSDKKDIVAFLHGALQRVYTPLSALMAFSIALPMYIHWEKSLLFLFGGASGVRDPMLGRDAGFYLFSLPVLRMVQKEVLLAFVILLLGVIFLYWYEHRALSARDRSLPRGARLHISTLSVLAVGLMGWGLMLERYRLLYETSNMPVFFGPGYVEMRIIVPLIWLNMVFLVAAGLSLIVCVHRGSGWKVPTVLGLLFVLSAMGKNADFFKDLVRNVVVAPNQIVRERSYIEASIRSTLAAYGLDTVETRDFQRAPHLAFDADRPRVRAPPSEYPCLGS